MIYPAISPYMHTFDTLHVYTYPSTYPHQMHPVVFIPSDGTSHDLNKQGPVQLLQRRLMTSIKSVAYPHHHKLVGFSRIHILIRGKQFLLGLIAPCVQNQRSNCNLWRKSSTAYQQPKHSKKCLKVEQQSLGKRKNNDSIRPNHIAMCYSKPSTNRVEVGDNEV